LAQELKDELGLYAVLIIEKRTGLPICNSKTLLDDSALVGSTNRVLITIEKVLPEFQLANYVQYYSRLPSASSSYFISIKNDLNCFLFGHISAFYVKFIFNLFTFPSFLYFKFLQFSSNHIVTCDG